MRAALDVHRELLTREVPHEIVRLRGSWIPSADHLPEALGVPAACCVAVRCFVTDRGPAAALVPALTHPEPDLVQNALAARSLAPATADEVNDLTDSAATLVCPVGLPAALVTLAEVSLCSQDVLYCPVGEGGVALGIRSNDLMLVSGARVLPLTWDADRAGRPPGAFRTR